MKPIVALLCIVLLHVVAVNARKYAPLYSLKRECTSAISGLFSSFEEPQYKHATSLKTYWTMYTDSGSEIIDGARRNDTNPGLWNIFFTEGTGSDSIGYSVTLDALFGTSHLQGATKRIGYAGVGFDAYDSTTSSYFDATTGKRGTVGPGGAADRILFDYRTDGNVDTVRLEVLDIHDVQDASNPERPYVRGKGNVYHRYLLPTQGNWVTTEIMFTDLEIDTSLADYSAIPLDIKHVARFNFRIDGAPGKVGSIGIDNVAFPNFGPCAPLEVIVLPEQALQSNTFHVRKNQILFPREMLTGSQHVAIELISVTGKVAASQRRSTLGSPIILSTAHVPPGVYLLTVRGLTSECGKKSVLQQKVTIVR